MKIPDVGFPLGTHPTIYEFYGWTKAVLNDGRYQLRVIDSVPNWTTSDGEMVAVDFGSGKKKSLYMYITDGWYNVSFDPKSGDVIGVPTGTVLPFAGLDTKIPDGFALCNGAAADRTTYSELFSLIGTAFGAGDSVSTFNLPDLRGRLVLGASGVGLYVRGFQQGTDTTSGPSTPYAQIYAIYAGAASMNHTHDLPVSVMHYIIKL